MTSSADIPPSPTKADYERAHAANADEGIFERDEPFALFTAWFADARKSEPNDPNGMAVATVDVDGLPDVRMVLLKDYDARGFVFYTNTESAKGRQLAAVPKAALLFHWKSLRRQVRVRGRVEPVTEAEADAYFATRARDSQIGAWASEQSRPMDGRLALEQRIAKFALRFGLGQPPRPPQWSGYRVVPEEIEFWRDKPFRLHDRLKFLRAGDGWSKSRLYP
ncbi:MAG: pyridoxamine 5'-phosphate oxidase [Caulobacteraceae bacterium]|nr:pyridoxamine 5'-phosphate oxidase [Caulobacteraceae bacterium]